MDAKSTSILIVDDEQEVREKLGQILTRKGYQVAVAEDGQEALDKFKELGTKIVICDIIMPKIDGIEFLKQVRSRNFSIEVIMITGHSSMERCVEAIENGASGYLRKPFQVEDVLRSIERAERNINERMEMIKEALANKSKNAQ